MTGASASSVARTGAGRLAPIPSLSNSQWQEVETRCRAGSVEPCQLQLSTLCLQPCASSLEVNEGVKRHLY